MNFPKKPNYTPSQINRAGATACAADIGSENYQAAIRIIDEWRASHQYPMQAFNVTLRNNASRIYRDAIVARRLKRMVTILDKIGNRQDSMSLSRMQDVGGVRAIMKTVKQVDQLYAMYLEKGRFPHDLKYNRDYIRQPKDSGYRGVHLVFKFNNKQGRQPDSRDWDGLLIEVQLRTELQHAWATSVEIVGTMLHEDLKSSISSELNSEWLTFFQYISSIMAQLENQPVLVAHANWHTQTLYKKAHTLVKRLSAIDRMQGWLTGMSWINEEGTSHYNILTLDTESKIVRIRGFRKTDLELANQQLAKLEAEATTAGTPQPVLVAAGGLKNLKRAYPNYALDSKRFLQIVQWAISADQPIADGDNPTLKKMKRLYNDNQKLS